MTKQRRSKYPAGTQCAYCGEAIPILEVEHVFPDSWYAEGTRRDQMMLVPACGPCNDFFQRMDADARILVLCCEPDDPISMSVTERVQRSFDPDQANSGVDRRARRRRREEIQAALCVVPESELGRAMWTANMTRQHVTRQTDGGIYVSGRPGMRVPATMQPIIVGKWTRGTYYYVNGTPLTPYARWSWSSPTAAGDPRRLVALFKEKAPVVFERPEFTVLGVTTAVDPMSSIWMFVLWNNMVFFGLTGRFADGDAVRIVQQASLG